MDLHVYTFEERNGIGGYQSATDWYTQDHEEADRYAQRHSYRVIDNTYTFDDSEIAADYTHWTDEDQDPEGDDTPPDRSLVEVIDQMLAIIPDEDPYHSLRVGLDIRRVSALYAAPELRSVHWGATAELLASELGDPRTSQLGAKVAAIFVGKDEA